MLRCARARAWRAPGPPLCLTDVKEERRVGGLARVQVLGQHARRELHGQLVAGKGHELAAELLVQRVQGGARERRLGCRGAGKAANVRRRPNLRRRDARQRARRARRRE